MPTFARAFGLVLATGLLLGVAGCAQPQSTAAPAVATRAESPATTPAAAAPAAAGSPGQQLNAAAGDIDKAIASAEAGDLPAAAKTYHEYDETWEKIEDGIRDKSRDSYKAIEDAMDEVQVKLVKAQNPDKAEATAALKHLRDVITAEVTKLG